MQQMLLEKLVDLSTIKQDLMPLSRARIYKVVAKVVNPVTACISDTRKKAIGNILLCLSR